MKIDLKVKHIAWPGIVLAIVALWWPDIDVTSSHIFDVLIIAFRVVSAIIGAILGGIWLTSNWEEKL